MWTTVPGLPLSFSLRVLIHTERGEFLAGRQCRVTSWLEAPHTESGTPRGTGGLLLPRVKSLGLPRSSWLWLGLGALGVEGHAKIFLPLAKKKVIATPLLKIISGGEHYLKEELEATWPHQSLCYDYHRKI